MSTREDNWQHRDATMRCGFCLFFVEKVLPLGRCRKNAPELGGWPAVFVSDWCGQHKMDDQRYAAVLRQQQMEAAKQAPTGGPNAQGNQGPQALRKVEEAGKVHGVGSADRAVSDGAKPGDGKTAKV